MRKEQSVCKFTYSSVGHNALIFLNLHSM